MIHCSISKSVAEGKLHLTASMDVSSDQFYFYKCLLLLFTVKDNTVHLSSKSSLLNYT